MCRFLNINVIDDRRRCLKTQWRDLHEIGYFLSNHLHHSNFRFMHSILMNVSLNVFCLIRCFVSFRSFAFGSYPNTYDHFILCSYKMIRITKHRKKDRDTKLKVPLDPYQYQVDPVLLSLKSSVDFHDFYTYRRKVTFNIQIYSN